MLTSLTSIASITLLVGLALIVVALLGGGVEAKEIKIPQLPLIPRAASFGVGCLLVSLVLVDPALFAPLQPPETNLSANSNILPVTKPPELGAAIKTHLITVIEVKMVLRSLGMYDGEIDNNPDNAYFKAVANFQRSRNIAQDGLVGGETYPKLREAAPVLLGEKLTNAPPSSRSAQNMPDPDGETIGRSHETVGRSQTDH